MPDLVRELAGLWRNTVPHHAYVQGWPGTGGHLFLPDEGTVGKIEDRISSIWKRTPDLSHRSFLRWAKTRIRINEPISGIEEALEALRSHLLISGSGSPDIGNLLVSTARRIELDIEAAQFDELPYEMRFLVLMGLIDLTSALGRLPSNIQDSDERTSLIMKLEKFKERTGVLDGRSGSKLEAMDILDSGDGTVGREDHFDSLLRDLYSCVCMKEQIEEELQIELYRLMPLMKKWMRASAGSLGVDNDIGEIMTGLDWERKFSRNKPRSIVEDIRGGLIELLDGKLLDISRTSSLSVIEAPGYLHPLIDSPLMFNHDGFSGTPSSVLYITGWDGRGGTSIPMVLLQFIRNDLGSRMLFNGSYRSKGDGNVFLDLLTRHSSRTMEIGYIHLVEDLVLSEMMRSIERGCDAPILSMIGSENAPGGYTSEDLLNELMFLSMKDRVMGVVSGLCDVKVNSGSTSLAEFVRWAHIITGIDTEMILWNCMEALKEPCLPCTSSMMLKGMKEVHKSWRDAGRGDMEFLERASTQGYPELRRFREKMSL